MSAPVQPVVITQSKQQVLDRMKRGDRLRWVPCDTLGIKAPCKGQRQLLIGNDMLDDESGLDVIGLEHTKKIVAVEDDNTGICDYVLS